MTIGLWDSAPLLGRILNHHIIVPMSTIDPNGIDRASMSSDIIE